MAKSKFTATKMTIGKVSEAVRFSYVHVFEKTAPSEDAKESYNVQIILPKKYKKQVQQLKGLIEDARQEIIEQVEPTKKQLRDLYEPLKDGDDDDEHERGERPELRGCYFFSAKSYERQPQVVASDGKTILLDDEDFYSGCYGRATIVVKAFENSGSIGVSIFLNNIQKFNVAAERLGGGASSAASDFGDEEIDDDEVMYGGKELDALADEYGF